MADISNLSNFLEDVADAIRTKKETTEKIPAANFDTEILSITTGMDTSDATATVNDIISPKTAYVNGEKITGTMPNNGELNYDVSTLEQIIPEGYTSGGTIAASPLTQEDYNDCLSISYDILNSNYTPLEYIESTGSQRIDTGVVPNENTIVEIEFMKLDDNVSYERIFGVKDAYEVLRDSGDSNIDDWTFKINRTSNNTGISAKIGAFGYGKNVLKTTTSSVYLNGVLVNEFDKLTPNTGKTMYLFYANNGDRWGTFRLYSCKIYNDTELIRDFVPMRDEDSVVCLYDNVTKTFFYNTGYRQFIGGEL